MTYITYREKRMSFVFISTFADCSYYLYTTR